MVGHLSTFMLIEIDLISIRTKVLLSFQNHCSIAIKHLGIQKPITLDLLLSGDNDISYAEKIALFNFVHEYIANTRRFKYN